jgi:photosystem II stability/assembly factor-like uncharacterized protein
MIYQWMRPALLVALFQSLSLQAWAEFQAPLDVPALHTELARSTPLNAVVRAGSRLLAAGLRGTIVYSDDRGATWRQAQVPSSTDLTALSFPTPELGWAVGQDGLVLHSSDGGQTWARQLDGSQLARVWSGSAEAAKTGALPLASMNFPLLDVWFKNAREGYVVGAFNLILHTEDGGSSWAVWSDRAQNPHGYHLYGIRPAGRDLFLVGEQGLVLKLGPGAQQFQALDTPYTGSYFSLVTSPDLLLIAGLRGNAYRSVDGGKSWQKVDTGIEASLSGGTISADGSLLLVSLSGNVLRSRDKGLTFESIKIDRPTPFFGVADAGSGGLAVVGMRGVRIIR